MQRDNYSLLIEKLDGFIRKFYINQLLRGSLYTVGAVLGLFVLLNLLEYYFYFGTGVRTAMLWGFVGLSGAALYRWVALPLMHYFHLGKIINHEQAAQIIGQHFTNVKDKLLNILQLKQQSSNNAIYADLINASVDQKSEEIKLVPFTAAIDLQKNRKYLRYALPPVLLLLFLFLGAPNILREGTMRLLNSTKKFEKPAPFHFKVNTNELKAVQFSDFVLEVGTEGQVLPNEMFIELGKVQYRLQKNAPNEFTYTFTNVQKDTEFKLFAGGIESEDYTLAVVRRPNILSFNVKLNFPAYIGRSAEELSNVGDLVLPQGTSINWVFNAQYTDELAMRFGADPAAATKRFDDELFTFNRRALKDESYKILLSNKQLPNADSVAYTITVIPDLHPQIAVEEFRDSTNTRMLFFAGDATDDYGLSNLTFNYQINRAKGGQMPLSTIKISKPSGKQIQYDYNWNIRDLDVQPGDEISYYFEVFDNDGVNGSKSARTNVMQWRMPTLDEYRKEQAQTAEEIQSELEKAMKESARIQEEMKKLRNNVLQKKELDWQSRKEMERLLDRQRQLQQQIEQAKENFEQSRQMQQEFDQQKNEELMEKQEQLQKMFEETVSEEMKKLMEDIEKLLQELNKDEMLEQMEQMQMSNEDMSKQLERLQELFKQLEVENMLQQQIEQLEELAREQEELAEKTESESQSAEELKKQQEELNRRMEELKKQHEEMKKKNEELKRPQKIEDSAEEMQDIQQDMQDAKQQMGQQGQSKKAGKKQKKAADKMKNLANEMRKGRESGEQEQMEEDIAMLRQLLENLIGLSFNQEQTMQNFAATSVNTPRYVELTQEQFKIKDDFKIVEDSLQALASRNFQIEGLITGKVSEIREGLRNSIDDLEERLVTSASEYQQRTMKGFNDLALMLSEVLDQMQQQMANGQPGSGSCSKPGGKGQGKAGKVPMDKITKGQGDLNEQMKALKQRLEQGKSKGQGKGQGEQGMSKEFAQMAAQQAALRNALRELQKQKQEQGKGSQALDALMEEMDKIETDLVNKRLTNEMIKRQQQILNRLLEEERAEREQEQDEQRQAQSAKQQPTKLPPALEDYLKKRRAEVDLFRTVSPALKPYYKQLVEEYIKGVGQ